MSATTTKVYAGVDVFSKGRLEVFVAPSGERFSIPNDDVGVDELLARLEESSPALVVLEATGGFERPVAAALVASGLAVAVGLTPGKRGTSPARRVGSPRPTADRRREPRPLRRGRSPRSPSHSWRGSQSAGGDTSPQAPARRDAPGRE